MKNKSFCFFIIGAYLSAAMLLILLSVYVNIFNEDSEKWKTGSVEPGNDLIIRKERANFLQQDNLQYNAFILGGSKAGALQPETFTLYTDNLFYNTYVTNGNFRDYGLFADFILKNYNQQINELVLHLSSHETEAFSRISYIPIQMKQSVFSKVNSFYLDFKENYLNSVRVYSALVKKDNFPGAFTTKLGARNPKSDLETRRKNEDINRFNNVVLSYWEEYDVALNDLFYKTKDLQACSKSIQELKKIKKSCDENNVKLTIIIGPTFIGELYKYASEDFIKYLKDLVSICDVWNFGGINNVNLNPYNFSNGGHYYYWVGNKMIETIYSSPSNTQNMDAFGILLTEENIDEYIQTQKIKWAQLKTEYDKKGMITLFDQNDESYIWKNQ